MSEQIKRVLVGTPSIDGKLEAWYTHSLIESVKLCMVNNIELKPIFMSYDSLLPRARNDLIKITIDGNYDAIIFIDSDQAWNPEWIVKLINYEEDVVGGAVIKKTDEQELYNIKSSFPIRVNERTGLMDVLSIGTGFLKISRAALVKLWSTSEKYSNEGKENRMMCEIKINDGELVSEDTVMCSKLKDLGYNIWLDSNMTCSHVGHKKWDGDFAKWYSKLLSDSIL